MADIVIISLDDPVDASVGIINSNFAALNAELGNHQHSASDITSGVLAVARLGTGAPSAGTFLRGDSQWASVGWGDVTGKPSTFPPSSHTHAPSDLTAGGASAGQVLRWSGSAWSASGGLYVDADGKLGIGTSGPSYDIHIYGSANRSVYLEADTGAAGALAQVRCQAFSGTGSPSGGFFVGHGGRGTKASPSATQAGDRLVALIGTGQQTTTSGTGAMIEFVAAGAWSDTNRYSHVSIRVNGPNQAAFPPAERLRIEGEGALALQPAMQTPSSPAVSSEAKIYVRNNKLIVQYNDAGTVRYKWLDLNGTGVTWQHSTTAP